METGTKIPMTIGVACWLVAASGLVLADPLPPLDESLIQVQQAETDAREAKSNAAKKPPRIVNKAKPPKGKKKP